VTPRILAAVVAARAARRPVVLATRMPDGTQLLIPDDPAPEPLRAAADRCLDADRSETVMVGDAEWFLHAFGPPPRLLIVGAVHLAQALAPMAEQTGFSVTVCDPRPAFATAERFPGSELIGDWPDEAIAALTPDRRTAIVALTHDPKIDDPALDAALRSEAFYVGALGSRRTQAGRLQRLAALGHDAAALARIHGPVGLPIGAVTAPEIAVAILAELIAARRGAAPPRPALPA
jgi:xanthine dehydrogenase accessory factor